VGTVGNFCSSCHIPVGTAVGQPRHMSIFDRATDQSYFPDGSDPYVSVEGVTCIACHRVKESYGRVNGQRRIEPGSIFEPMFGSGEGEDLADIIARAEDYEVATDPESFAKQAAAGHNWTVGHGTVTKNENLAKSEFCISCHQVAVHPGIKLEVVWDQYLNSPSHTQGLSCQDCHMSPTPGLPTPFTKAPKAVINLTESIGEILHKDHSFVGPGYSIAHPGIFPHRVNRGEFSLERMMSFDWRQPWGQQEFEDSLENLEAVDDDQLLSWFGRQESGALALSEPFLGRLRRGEAFSDQEQADFFGSWTSRSEREAAYEIVHDNQNLMAARQGKRASLMSNGSHLDGPFFDDILRLNRDVSFHLEVQNLTEGHNLPSGSLGAQPQLWINVALIDPKGVNIWESGYLDESGDLADQHSEAVLEGKIPFDSQLFNLQTKFLTTNVKGGDREMYLPVNFDVDQIPYIRPAGVPSTVLNHPPFIRMEGRSLPPLKKKSVHYEVPGSLITMPGKYTLAYRMRSRAEPIYFMKFIGASEDMQRSMNERMVDIHTTAFSFEIR
jgi:hypothetical protein